MLDTHEDGSSEIIVTPRVRGTKLVELALRHEVGHNVWNRLVPDDFKRVYGSQEHFAKAYSEVFRRGSESNPSTLKELWPARSGERPNK